MSAGPDLGPESLLGFPDGEDAATLRDRLDLALRYIANWYKATADSPNKETWWLKIDHVRAKVEAAYRSFSPNDIFLGNKAVGLYNEAALAFPGMYRELVFSIDTLPQPALIDQAANWFNAFIETPGYLVKKIGDMAARAVGGVAGSVLENLWPYLLLVGGFMLVWYFVLPSLAASFVVGKGSNA